MAKAKQTKTSSALDVVRQVLQDGKLSFHSFEGGTGFVVDLADELYEGAIAHLIEEHGQFVFYVELSDKATEKTRAQVTEFVTRANYGIVIGNFELDFGDGSVRYKSSVDYQGTTLAYELVRNAIVAARDSGEAYGPALVKVIKGEKLALAAIEEAEADG